MKNTTLIGSSLLGTWSAEVELSDPTGDNLTAYFMIYFMADPRKGHGCALEDCDELNNQVCMIQTDYEGYIKNNCNWIANESDVSWSDLNAFFYLGVKIDSKSKPKAKFELSTGEWIGPWNLIMAQDTSTNTTNATTTTLLDDSNTTLVDRYVARYVQSQSTMPVFLQNRLPLKSTLYNKPDDYVAFLGNSALKYMTQTQTNYTIGPNNNNNDTTPPDDPYARYLQTCDNGNVQPILPLIELEFYNDNDDDDNNNTTNHTATTKGHKEDVDLLQMVLKIQYKIMAVPSQDEQAYRVLPQLQSKFQGQKGLFNIMAGPYCYQQDAKRGHSFDLMLNSQHNATGVSFVRGCLPGYPCVPPAAMGGIPIQQVNASCHDHGHDHVQPNKAVASNVLLMFVSYTLAVALLISMTIHCHVMGLQRKKKNKKADAGSLEEMMLMNDVNLSRILADRDHDEEEEGPPPAGTASLLENLGLSDSTSAAAAVAAANQNEDVNPFGDLDPQDDDKVDPLQEPLLSSQDKPQEAAE